MSLPLFALVSLLSIPMSIASSEVSCAGQFRAVCGALGQRDAILERHSDGTLLFNPRVLTGQLGPGDASLLEPSRSNQNNFQNNLQPLFLALRDELIRLIESSSGRSLATSPYTHLRSVRLIVEDRERCRRTNRSPIVASYDQDRNLVTICPLMSHFKASSLLTILAHELGHAVDPCRVKPSNARYFFDDLSRCISGQCPRNPDSDEEETYADALASTLAQSFMGRFPQLVNFATAPETRFIEYVGYRLTGCEETQIYPGALAILENRQSPALLGCLNRGRERFSCVIP